jgi:hypothetical protein
MTTATTNDRPVIESLVLARLLVTGEKGEAALKIKKDFEPLLSHRWVGAVLTELIDKMLASLVSSGSVTLIPGKTKKASPRFLLTAQGRHRALEFLGVALLKPKTTWAALRKTYLPARALALPVSSDALLKAISSESGFQAVLLKRQFNLSTTDVPKPDEASDALAWKLIGFEGDDRKFNPKNVKTALFNRALGSGHVADFKKALTRLLAQRVGARHDHPGELRDAVLRGWIGQEENDAGRVESTRPFPIHVLVPSVAPLLDLRTFAERVKSAARDCPTGRFGDNKVFIAHVWKALHTDPTFATMELTAFKDRLAEANNARLLDLSRADLVQAMDPGDVSQSEVHYLNATFHFLRI